MRMVGMYDKAGRGRGSGSEGVQWERESERQKAGKRVSLYGW